MPPDRPCVQYKIYNMILRRWPEDEYNALKDDNTYSTTIHCLVSAVTKLSRVTKVPLGLTLYRGLGGVRLPDGFQSGGEEGFRCFVEWGFMSTTSRKEVAIQYTGAAQGRSLPTLLQVRAAAVDHGADISEFSQFPGEREFLWNPLSLVEPDGDPVVEHADDGMVTILPVRMNLNVKSLTVDELEEQKKAIHLSAFKVIVSEVASKFRMRRRALEARAQRDLALGKDEDEHKRKLSLFEQNVIAQCNEVLRRQSERKVDYFVDPVRFRSLVIEMLDFSMFADSAIRSYLEDDSTQLDLLLKHKTKLRNMHRRFVAFLERRYRRKVWGAPNGSGSAQANGLSSGAEGPMSGETEGSDSAGVNGTPPAGAGGSSLAGPVLADEQGAAWELCRVKGLLTCELNAKPPGCNALELVEDVEEPRIVAAAAEDLSPASLRLLVAARANVDSVDPHGTTAVMRAAAMGGEAVLMALLELGADPNKVRDDGVTAVHLAAWDGHAGCIRKLHELGVSVTTVTDKGLTPLMCAAENGHEDCVVALAELLGDRVEMERVSDCGMSAMHYAAKHCKAACVEALVRHHAKVDRRALVVARQYGDRASDRCYDCVKLLAQLSWRPRAHPDADSSVFAVIGGTQCPGTVVRLDESVRPFYVRFGKGSAGAGSDGWFARAELRRRREGAAAERLEVGDGVRLAAEYAAERERCQGLFRLGSSVGEPVPRREQGAHRRDAPEPGGAESRAGQGEPGRDPGQAPCGEPTGAGEVVAVHWSRSQQIDLYHVSFPGGCGNGWYTLGEVEAVGRRRDGRGPLGKRKAEAADPA